MINFVRYGDYLTLHQEQNGPLEENESIPVLFETKLPDVFELTIITDERAVSLNELCRFLHPTVRLPFNIF
jgi:hypothetical protein